MRREKFVEGRGCARRDPEEDAPETEKAGKESKGDVSEGSSRVSNCQKGVETNN